jgi:hypothetical protein
MTSLQNSVVNTYNVVTDSPVSDAQLIIDNDKLYQENDKLKQAKHEIMKEMEVLIVQINKFTGRLVTLALNIERERCCHQAIDN